MGDDILSKVHEYVVPLVYCVTAYGGVEFKVDSFFMVFALLL